MAKNELDITTLTPEQRDARLALDVERLLRFGRKHKLIKDLDVLVARNTLLDLLALAAPSEAKPPKEDPATPAALLDEMVELAAQKELFDGAVNQYRINFETRLMGALMPRESEVCKKFKKLYQKQGAKAATDWFYQLCVDTNYIRTAQIAKNIQWNTATPYGELEITINLTKPEKDPKTIALERLQPKSGYPACMLCKERGIALLQRLLWVNPRLARQRGSGKQQLSHCLLRRSLVRSGGGGLGCGPRLRSYSGSVQRPSDRSSAMSASSASSCGMLRRTGSLPR